MANPDIMIIDDDPMVGELSRDLLTDAGWQVDLVQDSMAAIPAIKERTPRLIITDIMMPGITGMDICKAVKSDPALKHIKIIVVSGKSYEVERQRALQFGADFFIQKPYDIETFSRTVREILESAGGAPAARPEAEAPKLEIVQEEDSFEQSSDLSPGEVRVTVWGARGLPATVPNAVSNYGRQTSCVSVETKEDIFIFDAGTGIIPLGREIVTKKKYYKQIWLFLTHFHLDHILGLGNFAPMHDAKFTVHIVGANDPERSLKEMAQSSLYSSFAFTRRSPAAKVDLYEVLEDNYELLPGVKMSTMYANHPTSTLIYSLQLHGKKIVYAPDSEVWGDATAFQDYDEKFGIFAKGADLLIHDANYDDKDYESCMKEGHSSLSVTVDFALSKAEAKELLLFHLNADYSDEQLDRMLADANAAITARGAQMPCHLAQEGKQFLLKGR
ncbi:MAG TPA: response regulator [Elusimicrobiales bacterium]|nr:response regulator [Elusimicrobiales bacterium]